MRAMSERRAKGETTVALVDIAACPRKALEGSLYIQCSPMENDGQPTTTVSGVGMRE